MLPSSHNMSSLRFFSHRLRKTIMNKFGAFFQNYPSYLMVLIVIICRKCIVEYNCLGARNSINFGLYLEKGTNVTLIK